MHASEIYGYLSKQKDKAYQLLKTYLTTEQGKPNNNDYLKLVEETPDIKFCVGDYTFVFKGEVHTTTRQVYFTTLQVVPNMDDYPKKKLVHVKGLDILSEDDVFYFREKKEIALFQGRPPMDVTVLRSFGDDYLKQINNHIATTEQIK